jgi:rfaE bifunctional protein kinase chain/domain
MYTTNEKKLTYGELQRLLQNIDGARIGLIGDLCLDVYWLADMKLSELSRETPHHPLPVVEERMSPGGAGNVANNIAALKPQKLFVAGLVGNDWRGELLLGSMKNAGIDCNYVICDNTRVTNTYIKPLRSGISDVIYEDPRLDFETRVPISAETEAKILSALDRMARQTDVICVSDQMKYGCITSAVRKKLSELGKSGKTVIVDSRDHADAYEGVTVKPNEIEASRAFGDGSVPDIEALSVLASEISVRNGKTTLITLGEKGCFVARGNQTVHCPACPVKPPIDFCGAGDTFLAGYGTLLASGATPLQAAQIACLCSSVTIKKLGETGTASREEILSAWNTYCRA